MKEKVRILEDKEKEANLGGGEARIKRQHDSGNSSSSPASLEVSVSENVKEIQIDELKKLMAIYE